MKTEVKKLWVEALRSGEYKQAKHKLRTDEGYCCLGVLCDLQAKAENKEWTQYSSGPGQTNYYFDGMSGGLSEEVRKWAGIEGEASVLAPEAPEEMKHKHLDNRSFLSELNDRAGYSFEQIAKIIEENL